MKPNARFKFFARSVAILLVFTAMLTFGEQRSAQQKDESSSYLRAEQVLEAARQATRLKAMDIKGLSLRTRTEISEPYPEDFLRSYPQFRNQRNQMITDGELSISFPDKIRQRMEMTFVSNQQVLERVLNGDRYAQRSEIYVDGKPLNFTANNLIQKSEQEKIADFKNSAFLMIFPITLEYSWYAPLRFKYVGVAEAKEGRADVIETALPNGSTYRLFFDQKTHLLLLMSEMSKDGREAERRYFFSDYRNVDGLLIAHKVTVEKGKEVVGERQIKSVQINPTFKPDHYLVKGKSN
ncbi:hypothetical protein PYK22_00174 [Pyrinomonas methylaliphatogenes]|uniref:Outer membrane lipoprotein-sorting protein n=2 Tax=Pyrinomonas methylaliphatogenes TaxID=454194 RepID=A0A0B6WU22_9BACT|nr:hypothetical protein PYK22_00174 [Pyrinomonas methylaliphatogenes]